MKKNSPSQNDIPAEPCCPDCRALTLRLIRPAEGATPTRMRGDYACDTCAWSGYHFPEATLPRATVEARQAKSDKVAAERAAGQRFFTRVNYSCLGDLCEHQELEESIWEILEDAGILGGRSGVHYVFLALSTPPSTAQSAQIQCLPGVTRIELR